MSFERSDYDTIHERAAKRIARIKRLFIHLMVTVGLAIGITVAVDRLGAHRNFEDIMLPATIILFVAHAVWLMATEASNYALLVEMMRAQQQPPAKQKRKRQLPERLIASDGEVLEIVSDESEPAQQTCSITTSSTDGNHRQA